MLRFAICIAGSPDPITTLNTWLRSSGRRCVAPVSYTHLDVYKRQVEASLTPVRERTEELMADPAELDRLLARGADRANELASATLGRVYEAVGLLR